MTGVVQVGLSVSRVFLVQSPCKDPVIQKLCVLAVLPLAPRSACSGEIKLKITRANNGSVLLCVFSSQVCMLCSVGYHLFACHRSEKTSRRWLSLDYAGISVGILGCYVPGIFYAFYCDAVSFNAGDGEI